MKQIAVSIKNVSFGYDKNEEVIRDVILDIPASTYVTIIGHNGSGKSTLAKLIVGLLQPASGDIAIFDEVMDEENLYELRKYLGIVFQNPDNQFVGATVADDIAFGLENRQVPNEEMDSIINDVAKKVGMENFLNKEPINLSGGQKQRAAIAGVLAMNPKIIIFDEATAMLDPRGKKEIRDIIQLMRKENPDLTLISITHDIEEAVASDFIYVMNEGKIVNQGTPKEVFASKEQLEEIKLDLPFFYKLKSALMGEGFPVSEYEDLESMVESLCK